MFAMKRFLTLAVALLWALTSLAQTPEEIVSRMDDYMAQKQNSGFYMVLDMKIPIVGNITSKTWSLGDKIRMESEAKGKDVIIWMDENTEWTYTRADAKVEIKPRTVKSGASSGSDESEMLKGITEGYDVSLSKETADAWYILCKKSRTNKKKDDPKQMELVVRKADYSPQSLSAKMSGVTVNLRDLSFDVPESVVTFNPTDYPGVTIDDKR